MTTLLPAMKAPLFWAGLTLASACGLCAADSPIAAPAPLALGTNVVVGPKAVFSTHLANARDPFFPDSTRLRRASPNQPNVPVKAVSVLDQLALKGVSISPKRRLALVNNLTLAEGEKAYVKVNAQSVLIQCVEVRPRSVTIAAPDTQEVKELELRKEI
jgi:hypothetical protein